MDPQIHVLQGQVTPNPGWPHADFTNLNTHSLVTRVNFNDAFPALRLLRNSRPRCARSRASVERYEVDLTAKGMAVPLGRRHVVRNSRS